MKETMRKIPDLVNEIRQLMTYVHEKIGPMTQQEFEEVDKYLAEFFPNDVPQDVKQKFYMTSGAVCAALRSLNGNFREYMLFLLFFGHYGIETPPVTLSYSNIKMGGHLS